MKVQEEPLGDVTITVDGPDGAPVTAVEHDFHLWTKQDDGLWKLYIDIWNSPAPLSGE